MKFGISLPNFGKYATKDSILEVALTAEELGFDSVWVSDHIVIPDSHEGFGELFFEPLTTLSYVASNTKNILLGSSVIILPYRNPIVLAKMVSTLDVLSKGRVVFGVGVGWLEDEFSALGVSYDERGSITDEWIEVLKALWTKDKASFKGKYWEFSNFNFLPKPSQKPRPQIWVGGNGKKAIERALKFGDGWHAVGLTPEEITERTIFINEFLIKESQKRRDFVISLRKNLQVVKEKRPRIPDDRETLRGTPDKITKGIDRLRESGVSHLIFQVLSGTLKGVFETMQIFSKDIRPEID
ncbi:MAG: LLM class flavin-dependent oxidoreductase [Thermodesulfobacteriota bacterium]